MTRPIMGGLLMAAILIAVAATLKYAQNVHGVSPEFSARGFQMAVGITLAVYANFIPKSVPASRGPTPGGGRAQSLLRVAGWAFAVAGLLYTLIWAFAPLADASPISMLAVGCALAATFAYTLWICTRPRDESAAG